MPENKDDYAKKRDFRRTPEPGPDPEPGRHAGSRVFVVHRHEARNLHYDLRVEVGGALSSWAVPRGFSYDPTEKRLAVRTEDHPMKYEHFEGVIPRGEYGAGTMKIWDRGRYELLYDTDPAQAIADGEVKLILYGRRLRGHWHLVKTNQGPKHWLLFKSKDAYSGPARDSALGIDIDIARERNPPARLTPMRPKGEGTPFSDPGWLFEMEFAGRRVLAEKRASGVRVRGLRTALPEIEAALARLRADAALIDGVLVATDEHGRPSPEALEAGLAGDPAHPVVLYAFDLLFWEEFDLRAIPAIERKTALRAVLPEEPGPLLYVDHVAGEGERLAEACSAAGLPSIIAKRADAAYRSGASKDWLRVEVDGAAQSDVEVNEALARGNEARSAASRVKLTNLEKVFWPAEGYTKGDLVAYYESVAEFLLPYLADRPVHMNRFPDGIEGKNFYQRHPPDHVPDWVDTEQIESSEGEDKRHILCNDRDTLIYMINSGSIDLHPWLSRRGSYDSPDWTILDLDPKEAPFADVVRIARAAGRILRGIGLRPLLKTSGKTGMHVLVPLEPGYSYEQSRMFCEGVARVIVRELPDIATVERNPSKREGKVYVDFGQNGRGQTVVPPYVVRPVPGATVSTPMTWDELDTDFRREDFTIRTVPPRLAELGDLFRSALTDRQDLIPAIEALAKYVQAG